MGSTTFIWGSRSRLVLRPIPLACLLDNCGIYSPPHHTYNILSGVSTFRCAVFYSPLQNDWDCCSDDMIWDYMEASSFYPMLFVLLQLPYLLLHQMLAEIITRASKADPSYGDWNVATQDLTIQIKGICPTRHRLLVFTCKQTALSLLEEERNGHVHYW